MQYQKEANYVGIEVLHHLRQQYPHTFPLGKLLVSKGEVLTRDDTIGKVQLQGHINRPIAFTVRRNFADLTTDAALTHIDRDYAVQKAIHMISGNPIAGRRADALARTLDYGKRKTRIRENKTVLV